MKEKAHKAVAEAIKRDLVTPYEEFAKSELGKETAIKNVDKVVEWIKKNVLLEGM